MLPFTKRPGRDESGDHDVVTKDDLVKSSSATPPPVSKRSVPPPASGAVRPKFSSINDEEMTTLMPTKSLGSAVPAVRPAAGAPPPSRSPSGPPSKGSITSASSGASSSRSGKFAAIEEEEEDGRTVVRGAPKIVKRSNTMTGSNPKMGMPTAPTTISPAAVIKQTLESARGAVSKRGEHLMAPPPADLLEDMADKMVEGHPADVGAEHTAILKAPQSGGSAPPPSLSQGMKSLPPHMLHSQHLPHGSMPPGSARPLTNPPASQPNQSGPYNAQQSGGYPAMYNGPVPSGSVSVPGVSMPQSMPAHFMVPQAPYSEGRIDPPGTAVTARTKVSGRPAMSWAMALAAFGLFVGVGAVAVMHGNGDGFMETSASFVDPSRAAAPKAAAAAQVTPPPATPEAAPATVGAPAVAVPGAAPPAASPEALAVAPVVTPTAANPPAPVPSAAAAPPPPPVAVAPPRPVFTPPRAPATPRVRATAAPEEAPERPTTAAAAPAATTSKGGAAGKGTAGKAAPEMDDETKRALEELRKAQLERSLQ